MDPPVNSTEAAGLSLMKPANEVNALSLSAFCMPGHCKSYCQVHIRGDEGDEGRARYQE